MRKSFSHAKVYTRDEELQRKPKPEKVEGASENMK
jgi:hypothetical protein